MSKYYIAYGSHLNLTLLHARFPKVRLVGAAMLENYRLVYKGFCEECSYLTIEPCEGTQVPVGIFEISLIDELRLNAYEGYPYLYNQETMSVKLNGQDIEGMVYVMNPIYDYNIPSEEHIKNCTKGFSDLGFDKSFLDSALSVTKDSISAKRIRNK